MDYTTLTDKQLSAEADAIRAEQQRRQDANPPQLAELVQKAETANSSNALIPVANVSGDKFLPGQKYVENGKEYRLKSGIPFLPKNVLPSVDTAGTWWEQTNLPPASTYPAWSATATYKPGDRVTRNGRIYECVKAHGPEYQGTWGPPATGVWKDLGPA